jgi:hypothetical protein
MSSSAARRLSRPAARCQYDDGCGRARHRLPHDAACGAAAPLSNIVDGFSYRVFVPIAVGARAPSQCAHFGRNMKRRLLLAGVSVLTACTAVSNVEVRPNGSLIVTSRARNSFASWNSIRNAGMKHANTYCREQNKRMHAISVHTIGVRGVDNESIEITFECF